MRPPALRPLSIRTRLTLWYTSVLLAILLVVTGLSYAMLGWTLTQDLDASLLLVAQVIRDTGYSTSGPLLTPGPEAAVREILGPEFYDKFFQLVDPEAGPGLRSAHLRDRALPLTAEARSNAAHGLRTFETVRLAPEGPVRLLTLPIVRNRRLVQLVQVGISLQHTDQTLSQYLRTLLGLIPLGVGLAVAGGAMTARAALRPISGMSRSARRITAEDLSKRLALRGTGDELDHLAGTLNAVFERLQDAFVQIQRFAADAAHELRTPLTALKGGMEVALRAERAPDEYRRVLHSSLEEVERLIRLAEDLLLMSRAAAGAGVSPARLDLEPLLIEVFDVAARLAQGTGVTVRVDQSMPATVMGDAAALRRAFRNLVENAVKYTPAGGKVELSLTCLGGTADLTVRDTGPGIDPADTERIFEPFVRLDAARTRETGGVGLGLAIARSIVVAHGGMLSVASTPGAGSQFTIRLPLA